ncbi:LOW QUALITY PROTEIN: protein DGCR6-like [Anomaloglossus baeobatrachus]
MAGYLGTYEEPSDMTQQQERHYHLLSELQSLVKDLPSSFQQRLSYTTLSDLALALIDGTVFEIVQGLLEIQHLTEKNLYNQRIKLHAEHRDSLVTGLVPQDWRIADVVPIFKKGSRTENPEEQRMMDEKIVLELDQKVIDQQNTLEKAGVSGFYVTTNPQEITIQMNLLELIRKLQQKESSTSKA